MEKFNLKIENISNGNITIVEKASINVLKAIIDKYESKQKSNNDEPDILVRNRKKIKTSKNYYDKVEDLIIN